MKKRRIAAGVAVLALVATACGGNEGATPETAPTATSMADMGMGDASPVRADRVTGAEVVTGTFQLLDTAPVGYDGASGSAWLARHDGGTTVTVKLAGLVPNSPHLAHVHAGTCGEGGGSHFRFDLDGGEMPPNEIHLMFTSDADGVGEMTAENGQVANDEARSLVVHPMNSMDAKVACADLG